MRCTSNICFHTNAAAPYRRHQFELLAERFHGAVFYLTSKQSSYRPWSNDFSDWSADVRMVTAGMLFNDLVRQKWGTIHVLGSGVPVLYGRLLRLSAMFGHSKLIYWDDGYTLEQVEKYKVIQKNSVIERIKNWLNSKVRQGIFTPGTLGAEMARARGYRENQIINAYFSHDVEKFTKFRIKNGATERLRIRKLLDVPEDKILILNISRFLNWKRLIDLFDALRELEITNINAASQLEVLLIGDGNCHDHEEIMRELKIIKIHVLKQMPPDEILPYYCGSDIFVFPSEGDIWGLVVNEALSMGLPVICTSSIGASEIVEDGRNGYVIPRRSPALIAERICRLLDYHTRCKFSEEAVKIRDEWNTAMGIDELARFVEGV